MEIRLPESVESVVSLETDDSGRTTPLTRYKKKGPKKKKGTIGLRQTEKFVRKMAQAQQAFIDAYLSRHDDSETKKRNGWIVDSPSNLFRATETGLKKLF